MNSEESDAATIEFPAPSATCPFCDPEALEMVIEETEHFFLLVDHAPLVEGHLLIVPRAHFPCYGAVPAALDAELLALKGRVTAFLEHAYRLPVYFEHGVFHQTVYHAHLHAFPLGPVSLHVHALAAPDGQPVTSQDDIRAWYAERGRYFYLETLPSEGVAGEAALFPPDETYYWRALGTLRERSADTASWLPPSMRRAFGRDKMQTVAAAWERFRREES